MKRLIANSGAVEKAFKGREFTFKAMGLEKELEDEGVDPKYYGEKVKIVNLAVYIDDSLENNYWDIEFSDGTSLNGISGYHLK